MDRWKRDDPCRNVNDLARALPNGLWLNLLTADLEAAIGFQTDILGCEAIYRDAAFAIMRFGGTVWMLHSDASYSSHPFGGIVARRGAGCEIRLQGCAPDAAEARARAAGFAVMAATKDKPHGLRETFLIDLDGYVWVPCTLTAALIEAV